MVASTTARNFSATPITEVVTKAGEQLVSAVKQGQDATLDAAKAVAKVTASIPAPDFTKEFAKIDGAPELPDFGALATSSFDLVIELLTAQRDFAVKLVAAFAPAKAV